MADPIWPTKCEFILNLDESFVIFLTIVDIFNDESEFNV